MVGSASNCRPIWFEWCFRSLKLRCCLGTPFASALVVGSELAFLRATEECRQDPCLAHQPQDSSCWADRYRLGMRPLADKCSTVRRRMDNHQSRGLARKLVLEVQPALGLRCKEQPHMEPNCKVQRCCQCTRPFVSHSTDLRRRTSSSSAASDRHQPRRLPEPSAQWCSRRTRESSSLECNNSTARHPKAVCRSEWSKVSRQSLAFHTNQTKHCVPGLEPAELGTRRKYKESSSSFEHL